jgi:exosortase
MRKLSLNMANGSASITVKFSSMPFNLAKAILYVALTGLIISAYWMQPAERGGSCYSWMVTHWYVTSNYSHGPLIPLIASSLLWWNVSQKGRERSGEWKPYWRAMAASGAVLAIWMLAPSDKETNARCYQIAMILLPFTIALQVWTLRRHLRSTEEPEIRWGGALVAIAMAIYWLGMKAVQPRVTVFSGVLLLYGLALSFRGRDVFRICFFPITMLFLMIPLNFLDNELGLPLRLFVAKAATALLNWFGIEAINNGSAIYSRVFRFDVADPCSGIRSLMALTTVTAAYAYVTQTTQWKRWVLFLAAAPLAVLGNMARVVSIALVAQVYGQNLAGNIYHQWSGFILFPVALAAMVVLGVLLNLPYRRVFEYWTKPVEQKVNDE